MQMPFRLPLRQATLAQRFMLASLVILIVGMLGIGVWVGNEIKNGVIHRTGATTALYVDSFVAPLLQELGTTGTLSPQHNEQIWSRVIDQLRPSSLCEMRKTQSAEAKKITPRTMAHTLAAWSAARGMPVAT